MTAMLEHPASPLHGACSPDPMMRRVLMGIAMGLTAAAIIYSPWGRRSGAHMNPAVTLTFLRLGKDRGRDALAYVGAQFVGGVSSASRSPPFVLRHWIAAPGGELRRHRARARSGHGAAFAAEAAISFVMMLVVLQRPTSVARRRSPACIVGDADRDLHHARSAALGHEHEPGAHVRPGSRRRHVARRSGSTSSRRRSACSPRPRSTCASRGRRLPIRCAKLHHDSRPVHLQRAVAAAERAVMPYSRITTTSSSSAPAPAAARSPTAWRRPASASCSSSAATTCRARRTTGARARSTSKRKYHTKEVWRDKDGKPLHPHTNYYVGGNTKFYGAALFRLREEDFGELRHHGGVSPAWPISYDELEPYYTEAEHLYQVHGERGEDPTEPRGERAVSVSGGQPRAAHPAAARRLRARSGTDAVPRAARHHARREEPADQPLHPLRHLRRLPVPGARQVRRAGGLRRPGAAVSQRHAADQRLRRAAGDERVRPRGDSACSSSATARPERYSADIVVVSCGAINSAALLLRSANDRHPRGLANGSGRRRPALHGARQLGADGALEVPEPDRLPEDARRERLLLRRRRSWSTRWATSRSSASSTP